MLAYAVCRENLSKFKDAFEKAAFKKSTSVVLDFELIEPLVQYGIPKAKYYLGYCLLKGIQLEENETRGIALLPTLETAQLQRRWAITILKKAVPAIGRKLTNIILATELLHLIRTARKQL